MAESGEAGGKVGDLYLGVVDLFAVILPGGLFSAVVWKIVSTGYKDFLEKLAGPQVIPNWLLFLVVSYIVGHFLFALGSWLIDPLYDRYYKHKFEFEIKKELPSIRRRADRLFDELLSAKLYREDDNRLTWSESFLRVGSGAAKGELDRLEADSKFFRSLAVVAILSLIAIFSPLTGWVSSRQWLPVAVAVLVFAILVHFIRKGPKPKGDRDEPKRDFDERVKRRLLKHLKSEPPRHELPPRLDWPDAEWLEAEATENNDTMKKFRRIARLFPAAWTVLALVLVLLVRSREAVLAGTFCWALAILSVWRYMEIRAKRLVQAYYFVIALNKSGSIGGGPSEQDAKPHGNRSEE
jgi:hypothetical protein